MSFATDKWFRHVREELLVEGLADIGLSESTTQSIRIQLPDASEKGRVWVGNAFKEYYILGRPRDILYKKLENFIEIPWVTGGAAAWEIGEHNIITQYKDKLLNSQIKFLPKARKSFIKGAKKLDIDPGTVEVFLEIADRAEAQTLSWFFGMIENVLITLNQNPNNYEMLKDFPPSDWAAAEEKFYEFQQNQEDPAKSFTHLRTALTGMIFSPVNARRRGTGWVIVERITKAHYTLYARKIRAKSSQNLM